MRLNPNQLSNNNSCIAPSAFMDIHLFVFGSCYEEILMNWDIQSQYNKGQLRICLNLFVSPMPSALPHAAISFD